VAVCSVGGQDVGAYLVAKGLAVAYVHYSTAYVPAETAARSGGLGLWAGAFDRPWDWPKAQRRPQDSPEAPRSATAAG
jgi:endonuclease YncB( thermonuclease family)